MKNQKNFKITIRACIGLPFLIFIFFFTVGVFFPIFFLKQQSIPPPNPQAIQVTFREHTRIK